MFEQFMTFLASLNDNVIWGIPMVVLMIGTGLFLLIVTKGVIFRHFGIVMRYTTKTLFQKKDKSRESWYNFFTFGNWGVASNYDLCLDSSILGLEGTADFIIDFARRAGLL